MESGKRSTLITLGVIVAGDTSGGFVPSSGQARRTVLSSSPAKGAALAQVPNDFCHALWDELEINSAKVPMASFFDYYCPYSRVQTKRLVEMTNAMPNEVAVARHGFPLLGGRSNLAATAALPEKRQGAYVTFHKRLMATLFHPAPEYLSRLAGDLGVDEDRLISDKESTEVVRELENSSALACVFAFFESPGLVINRTVVQGQISDKMVREIIDLEREKAGIQPVFPRNCICSWRSVGTGP